MATELKDIILQQQLKISELNAKLEEVSQNYVSKVNEFRDLQHTLHTMSINADSQQVIIDDYKGKYDKLIFEIQDQPHDGTCNVVVNETLKQEIKELKEKNQALEDYLQDHKPHYKKLQDKLAKIEGIINKDDLDYSDYARIKKLKEILDKK